MPRPCVIWLTLINKATCLADAASGAALLLLETLPRQGKWSEQRAASVSVTMSQARSRGTGSGEAKM